jgi:hypothetical protein
MMQECGIANNQTLLFPGEYHYDMPGIPTWLLKKQGLHGTSCSRLLHADL